MTKDLVIAHYQRGLGWVEQLRGFNRQFVYHKGDNPPRGAIQLPNIGIDSHVHLHHIAAHYSDLADLTVFAQDFPFDHSPNFVDVANGATVDAIWQANQKAFPNSKARVDGFIGIGDYRLIHRGLIDQDAVLKGNAEGKAWQYRKYALIAELWKRLKPARVRPSVFPSTWGSQLVLSRERIQLNSREFYCELRDWHYRDVVVPSAIENLWWFLFQCDVRPCLT